VTQCCVRTKEVPKGTTGGDTCERKPISGCEKTFKDDCVETTDTEIRTNSTVIVEQPRKMLKKTTFHIITRKQETH